MTLKDWIEQQDLTLTAFAGQIGRSVTSIHRYCLPRGNPNRRKPDEETMALIVEATGGKVRANDFYEAEPGKARAA